MKRFAVLLLAMVYFAVCSGFTVHMHYCMGHFVKASLIDREDDAHECPHCGMVKKKRGNGCCNDEHKVVKGKVDHSLVKELKITAPAGFVAVLPPSLYPEARHAMLLTDDLALAFSAHGPPDPDICPIYLQIRNLRI